MRHCRGAPGRAGGTGARRWFSRPAQACSARRTSWRPGNSSTTGGRCSADRSRRALCAVLWRRPTPTSRARIERARAASRRVVWTLRALRPGGFPWIWVCGREPANGYVLDLDATVVTCTSRTEDAAGSFGHMPVSAWVAGTRECVALLLRPGTAPPRPTTSPATRRSGLGVSAAPAAAEVEAAGTDPTARPSATPCPIISHSCPRAGAGCAG